MGGGGWSLIGCDLGTELEEIGGLWRGLLLEKEDGFCRRKEEENLGSHALSLALFQLEKGEGGMGEGLVLSGGWRAERKRWIQIPRTRGNCC